MLTSYRMLKIQWQAHKHLVWARQVTTVIIIIPTFHFSQGLAMQSVRRRVLQQDSGEAAQREGTQVETSPKRLPLDKERSPELGTFGILNCLTNKK